MLHPDIYYQEVRLILFQISVPLYVTALNPFAVVVKATFASAVPDVLVALTEILPFSPEEAIALT